MPRGLLRRSTQSLLATITIRYPVNEAVFILGRARTPIGAFGGSLSDVPAIALGAVAIRAALQRANLSAQRVDEIIFGNVVSAGLGQNPARQTALQAGLSEAVGATTINKVCGSGLKAVMLAAQSIALGENRVVVAGGMESMSRAPYLLPGARTGYRLGHGKVIDAMIHDGLWDAYGDEHMGHYGDLCARRFGFTRCEQDDFAVRSYTRALAASRAGNYAEEIVPVEVSSHREASPVAEDEEPLRFNETKLRALKPAFQRDGTITAGNASSINDGAAAVVVASPRTCEELGIRPLARIVGSATFSGPPAWFTTAPIGAIRKLLENVGWSIGDIDLFEINEAFAAVALAAERELDIPESRLNVFGGAVALGHPIGASGARILTTLLTAMEERGASRGVAALCIGGGEAVAMAVEAAG